MDTEDRAGFARQMRARAHQVRSELMLKTRDTVRWSTEVPKVAGMILSQAERRSRQGVTAGRYDWIFGNPHSEDEVAEAAAQITRVLQNTWSLQVACSGEFDQRYLSFDYAYDEENARNIRDHVVGMQPIADWAREALRIEHGIRTFIQNRAQHGIYEGWYAWICGHLGNEDAVTQAAAGIATELRTAYGLRIEPCGAFSQRYLSFAYEL